jgi:hypothetical protein
MCLQLAVTDGMELPELPDHQKAPPRGKRQPRVRPAASDTMCAQAQLSTLSTRCKRMHITRLIALRSDAQRAGVLHVLRKLLTACTLAQDGARQWPGRPPAAQGRSAGATDDTSLSTASPGSDGSRSPTTTGRERRGVRLARGAAASAPERKRRRTAAQVAAPAAEQPAGPADATKAATASLAQTRGPRRKQHCPKRAD